MLRRDFSFRGFNIKSTNSLGFLWWETPYPKFRRSWYCFSSGRCPARSPYYFWTIPDINLYSRKAVFPPHSPSRFLSSPRKSSYLLRWLLPPSAPTFPKSKCRYFISSILLGSFALRVDSKFIEGRVRWPEVGSDWGGKWVGFGSQNRRHNRSNESIPEFPSIKIIHYFSSLFIHPSIKSLS